MFKDVCERVTHQVQNSSFCAEIFDIQGLLTTVNNIRVLKKEELVKHCREPYQWSKGIRPGDVIASEVRVTSDKSELQVNLISFDFKDKRMRTCFYCKWLLNKKKYKGGSFNQCKDHVSFRHMKFEK